MPARRGTRGWMTESGLVVVAWSNWGKHRLYVNTAEDEQVGWLDRDTGEPHLGLPHLAAEFEAALQEAAVREESVQSPPRRVVPEPVVDLAERRPGEHLQSTIDSLERSGRELKPAAPPDFEGRRAYSSWHLGLLGEQAVAAELERLVELDPRWSFLNSIPVRTRSDIDHLVIGPGGIFTINTKHHHGGVVWVAEGACLVNQTWRHYVNDSRAEAELARTRLSAATGVDIAVTGLVVMVGVEKLTVKAQCPDVQVLDQSELVDVLLNQPPALAADTTAAVLQASRNQTTWR